MNRTTNSVVLALAFALAVAALIAPAALAGGTMPDAFERAVNARIASTPPDAFERAVATHQAGLLAVASPGRAVVDVVQPTSSTSSATAATGFDWSSAFVGGSAMLGFVLLAAGAALTVTRHGRGQVAIR